MRRFILLLTALALLILPSCAENDTVGGRPVTPEELESISAEVFGTNGDPAESETAAPNPNAIVYWLESGSVYHTDPDCSHLSGKRNVKQTTRRTAESGGLRACKSCENE